MRVFWPVGGKIERTNNVQAVVHAYHNHIAELAQVFAIVGVSFHGRTVREPATMHPDHHRLLGRLGWALGPDIQNLAMLIFQPVAMRKHKLVNARRAHIWNRRDWTPRLGAPDSVPGLHRLWQLK